MKIFDHRGEAIGGLCFGVGRQQRQVVVEMELERRIGYPVQLSGEGAAWVGVSSEFIAVAVATALTPLHRGTHGYNQFGGLVFDYRKARTQSPLEIVDRDSIKSTVVVIA